MVEHPHLHGGHLRYLQFRKRLPALQMPQHMEGTIQQSGGAIGGDDNFLVHRLHMVAFIAPGIRFNL